MYYSNIPENVKVCLFGLLFFLIVNLTSMGEGCIEVINTH